MVEGQLCVWWIQWERQRPQGLWAGMWARGKEGRLQSPTRPLSTSRCALLRPSGGLRSVSYHLQPKKLHHVKQKNSTFGWNRLPVPVSSSSLEDSPAGGYGLAHWQPRVGSGAGQFPPCGTGKTQEDDGGRNLSRLSRAQWVIQ